MIQLMVAAAAISNKITIMIYLNIFSYTSPSITHHTCLDMLTSFIPKCIFLYTVNHHEMFQWEITIVNVQKAW